jgi:hypothetical protein
MSELLDVGGYFVISTPICNESPNCEQHLQDEIAIVSSSNEQWPKTRLLQDPHKPFHITALESGAHPGLCYLETNSNKRRDVPSAFALMAISTRYVDKTGRLNAQARQSLQSLAIKLAIQKVDKALARAL